MALPPTELSWYDVEDDIADTELSLERFLAMQEVRRGLGWGLGVSFGCAGAAAGWAGWELWLATRHQWPAFLSQSASTVVAATLATIAPSPRHDHLCRPTAQGLDLEGVDALFSLLRQEQRAHPGYLGGLARPSQQLRQHTPPVGLSAEGTQAVRQVSVKLFQVLGLRDLAQFSGWVLPEQLEQRTEQQPAAEQQAAEQAAAAGVEGTEQQQQDRRGKSFAELLAIDAAVRAEQAAADSAAVSSADREGALDTTAAASSSSEVLSSAFLQESLVEAEGAAAAGRSYGSYNGIQIDDSYRMSPEDALAAMAPFHRCAELAGWASWGGDRRWLAWDAVRQGSSSRPGYGPPTIPPPTNNLSHSLACRPIPLAPPPEPVVSALEDLSSADPAALCQFGSSGQVVAFATLRCALWFGLGAREEAGAWLAAVLQPPRSPRCTTSLHALPACQLTSPPPTTTKQSPAASCPT